VSAIDRHVYEFADKKSAGQKKVYQDLRRVVLITNTWKQRMTINAEHAKGWRGSYWHVSRSEPTQEPTQNGGTRTSYKDSPRVGDVWFMEEKYDEEKIKNELEKGAATYGLPVEKFAQPLNYEVLLKPKDHAQLVAIANDIRSDESALKDPEPAAAAAPAAAVSDKLAEAELNY